MKTIKLFVDVDEVLTQEPVNVFIAREIGVLKPLMEYEKQYSLGNLDSAGFGLRLVQLFKKAELTESRAVLLAQGVQLRSGVSKLLSLLPGSTYLVSSGPDYYVQHLAKRHGISPDHVMCSKYSFHDGPNRIINGCDDPIDAIDKIKYVRDRIDKDTISIGVGNHPAQDGGFVQECSFGFLALPDRFPKDSIVEEDLLTFRTGFLNIVELKILIDFIAQLIAICGSREVGTPRDV